MKRTMMLVIVCLILFLGVSNAFAYTEEAYGAENTPQEIRAYLAESSWSGWEITGWVRPGTHNNKGKDLGPSAFVAVKQGMRNDLLAFYFKDGHYSFAWNNPAALPQVEEPIILGMFGDAGGIPRFQSHYVVNNETAEAYCKWVQDEDGTWNLHGMNIYYDPTVMFIDTSRSGVIHMENIGWTSEDKEANIYGEYQRNLRHFSYAAFPRTIDDAREKLSMPPEIPTGYTSDLTAEKIKFTGGKKYPVYTGPGEDYVRSGNGKGSVSTNDWIQVFGEENDWIMIQYDISSDRFRIGWIDAKALPKNANVSELCYEPVYACLTSNAKLTDDPLNSKTQISILEEGTTVLWLATMGEWAYIEIDGNLPIRGFVKAESLETQVFDATEAAKNLLTEVYGYEWEEAEYGFDYQTIHQGSNILLIYSPKAHPEWAYTLMMNKATGETFERTTPFATEYEGYPGEGAVRFELSKKDFGSEEEVEVFFESCYGPQSGWSAALHGWCAEEMSKTAH